MIASGGWASSVNAYPSSVRGYAQPSIKAVLAPQGFSPTVRIVSNWVPIAALPVLAAANNTIFINLKFIITVLKANKFAAMLYAHTREIVT